MRSWKFILNFVPVGILNALPKVYKSPRLAWVRRNCAFTVFWLAALGRASWGQPRRADCHPWLRFADISACLAIKPGIAILDFGLSGAPLGLDPPILLALALLGIAAVFDLGAAKNETFALAALFAGKGRGIDLMRLNVPLGKACDGDYSNAEGSKEFHNYLLTSINRQI